MNRYVEGVLSGGIAASCCVAAAAGVSASHSRRLSSIAAGLAAPAAAQAAAARAAPAAGAGQQLAGKVALITGGGTGVGKVTALAFAAEGAHIVLAGRRPGPIEEVAAECEAMGVSALAVPTDLGDPAAVEALFAACKDTFGRLDILFNNAGMGAPGKLLEDLTFNEWNNVVSANLTGSFLCTQQAFKLMKAQEPMGGRIINNGSISADRPRPNSSPYTATKHAITGLTKASSLDGRKYNIAVGQIDIGNAATEMTSAMGGGVPQANGELKPEPTFDATDVAKACVYMSSLGLEANVLFMTVMASAMPYVGRG